MVRATPATARGPARASRPRRSSSAWADALPHPIAAGRARRRVSDVVGIIHPAPEAQDRPDIPGKRPRVAETLELHPTPRAERRDGLIVDESAGPGAVEPRPDRPPPPPGGAPVERAQPLQGPPGGEQASPPPPCPPPGGAPPGPSESPPTAGPPAPP